MKPRLTYTEHTELGRVLAGIRDELTHRRTQLHTAYPKTGHEAIPARTLENAVQAIDAARQTLEDLCYREHPNNAHTHTYWPNPEHRATITTPTH
ncbi:MULTISPECIES: hypothetical protein [Streptomyces]|uniref:Uncharacterized protein n=1 Tax=Streptomyces dengpaensis TaxID=2049881 RepID=A0ABN5I9P4_9ACTN|nr:MULTISPECIES: hypothetical protein [Streptomyces]AVH59726.1 hypothetical protein C4B68_32680 [Streptomyces dengpaensis]PIB09370.1 hypothetical protein B1C81_09360 [Streptomyces sp. HG99]